jgi:hypothetical protein
MHKNESVVIRSRQVWKLVVGFAVLTVGFGVMVYGVQGGRTQGSFELAMTGVLLALAGVAWACLSIRCRACGMRWLWFAVKTQDRHAWLQWLLSQRVCPSCGNDPAKGADELGPTSS